MPFALYLAFKQLFPTGRRFPLFAGLSILGVACGVALVFVVQSVMSGFGQIHREKLVQTSGHLEVGDWGRPFVQWQTRATDLRQRPEVAAATPYASGIVMLKYGSYPTFPGIRGYDLSAPTAIPLQELLLRGRVEDLDDEAIFLSSELARTLGVALGESVEVYTPLMIDRLKQDEVLLPRELRVAGVFETGWNRFDSATAIVSLRTMQDLYGLGDAVHGITVRCREGVDEFAFATRLNTELRPWLRATTWKEQWADFLWVLDLEKTMILFITLVVIVAIATAIGIILYLIVVRKTREIGLLGALGARPGAILTVYGLQSLIVGLVGTPLGFLLGAAILSVRDPVIDFLAGITGTKETLVKFYEFAHLPVAYRWQDVAIIASVTLLLSVIAGLIPAWLAARMRPAAALRSDV